MTSDLLIKNGHIIDPASNRNEIGDIAIKEDRIVAPNELDQDAEIIDVKESYVFPGLIDFHTHIFRGGSSLGGNPDFGLATGVTAMTDAGTAGGSNFDLFFRSVVENSQVKIKSYLNAFTSGQIAFQVPEHFSTENYDFAEIKRIFKKYPEQILGLKIRFSKGVATDLSSLASVIEMAEELQTGICVHTTNPPDSLEAVANMLRPGDVYCHVYQGRGESILNDESKVKPAFLRARERGVLFDSANGFGNFSIETAKAALADGFEPDIISTDWLKQNINRGANVRNLPAVMSKYLELGMPLERIIKCVTATPAKVMKMEDQIGTLKAGAFADIAVCQIVPGKLTHQDSEGRLFESTRMIVPKMVLSDGLIAYRELGFGEI